MKFYKNRDITRQKQRSKTAAVLPNRWASNIQKGIEKVRNVEDLEDELITMIKSTYFWPHTMAKNPCCLETSLWTSHIALALARDTEDVFGDLHLELYRNAPFGLYEKLKKKKPMANDEEAFEYILSKWKQLSREMGIPIDKRSKLKWQRELRQAISNRNEALPAVL